MNEIMLYGQNGLFHNIIRQSSILNGRYAIIPRTGADLNANNLLSGLDFPAGKYPGVFCAPPYSVIPTTTKAGYWERLYFRLYFLTTTLYTGDNQIKFVDTNTNTSMHTINQDWSEMKELAFEFIHALESIQLAHIKEWRLGQKDEWQLNRMTNLQNDRLTGVCLHFEMQLPIVCDYEDINVSAIDYPIEEHITHFH